jgi:hypothetical protein
MGSEFDRQSLIDIFVIEAYSIAITRAVRMGS